MLRTKMLSLVLGATLVGFSGQTMASVPAQDDFITCVEEASASCEDEDSEDEIFECILNAIVSCLES